MGTCLASIRQMFDYKGITCDVFDHHLIPASIEIPVAHRMIGLSLVQHKFTFTMCGIHAPHDQMRYILPQREDIINLVLSEPYLS